MEYSALGKSGLQVSKLCLGTMNFGKYVDEQTSFEMLDIALDAGINFIDTADVYGGIGHKGRTEEYIGKWMSQSSGRREKIILATKVYGKMGEGINDRGLSAYHIRSACEASLLRLKTDHIDLYQMHHIDRLTPWDEIWQAMDQLIHEGKIIYNGSSNFAAWNIVEAQFTAHQRNHLGLISEQSLYNLTNRMIELEVVPACRKLGIGIIPWSPLAEGLIAGILNDTAGARKKTETVQKKLVKHIKQVEEYEKFCSSIGKKPEAVAIAWLLKNPVISSVIIGPRTIEQLNGMVEALNTTLNDEETKIIETIWPGPGGEAPEAYAW
jgi:aryl-alcohol dehydrogenase-like predicted oxidoreductase